MSELHIKKARFLTFVLRHNPEAVPGLIMSNDGWVTVSSFVPEFLSENELQEIVDTDSKGRFEIRVFEAEKFIRCRYGHSVKSVNIDLNGSNSESVPDLFHATTVSAYESIKEQGICKMQRNMVHLSNDKQIAIENALRYAKTIDNIVLLKILNPSTLEGLIKASNNIWVVPHVPISHIMKDTL